jgi:hypothetical protein
MREHVLIIAPEDAARPLVAALRRQPELTVEVAGTRRAGLNALRNSEWSLVLMEENISGADPDAAELLYLNAGSAVVLEMNFAITSAARALRQVRAALVRRAQDRARARVAASAALQGELRSALAGLLLESQLALREAPPGHQAKLRQVVKLAGELRTRLTA